MREAGVVLAALLAASAVLARSPRASAAAALAALALTPVLLLVQIWDSEQLRPLREQPATFAALGAAALAALAVAAVVMARRPSVFPVAAVVVLPFRIPVSSGTSSANLLVPLYFVIAAGVLAWAVPRLRAADAVPDVPAPPARERALDWALLGSVVLYAVQASYSEDLDKALEQVVFFYVPFALLYATLRRVAWSRRLVAVCLGAVVVLAVAFAGVGFWEYDARRLLLNPKVTSANQFASYFRVNSLFFDPNIYGRFLAMVMIGIAAVLLWSARRRDVIAGGLLLALLWGGLVLTFSQSSFAALLAGLAVLAALRWSARWTAAVVAGAVALGVAFVLVAPNAVRLELGSAKSADTATSGRYDLVRGGVELFADRPLQGYGAGSFSRAYRREQGASSQRAVSASHTIPVTVAAEQGVGGLLLYLAVVALGVRALVRRARRDPVRAALAAAFVALVVHTLLYAAFLEDPLAWVLLGIGTSLPVEPEPAGG